MKLFLKILAGLVAGIILLVTGLVAVAYIKPPGKYQADYPDIHASTDPEVIAHGKYLAYGPAYCAHCHLDPSMRWTRLEQYPELPPLNGGQPIDTPFGTYYVTNITPDSETGIGKLTDQELARLMRYSVHPDGRSVLPFMDTQNLNDNDLRAIISYLRSQPAIHNPIPADNLTVLGKLFEAYALKPGEPDHEEFNAPAEGDLRARGEYLANDVAQCRECHTRYSIMGEPLGPLFSGGRGYIDLVDAKVEYVTPNLTPDPKTGRLAGWTFEVFRHRFKVVGRIFKGSAMPWESFALMTDEDLLAIFTYLNDLDPVHHDTGPQVIKHSN